MDRPAVSIVICTRNRARSLRETLTSISATSLPPDLVVELVVVDNGSTDETRQVIDAHPVTPALPLRVVSEPLAGVANARNAGLRHTVSEVLLCTDDDVRVPQDWIAEMCRPILGGEADAVAGGVVFPVEYGAVLSQEPFRFRREWLASTEKFDSENPRALVGANMAFSRRSATAVGGFDPALGPGALGFAEETLFAERLMSAGFHIKGKLEVSVVHHFDLSRLTVAALLGIAERMGRSTAYLDYHWYDADTGPARANIRRARLLLALERSLRPWRLLSSRRQWQMTQRVMTLAYWQQLASYEGQPRRYLRSAAIP